jgi:hypothetical protein
MLIRHIVAGALVAALTLAAPAQAHEFNMPWGHGFIDDKPFHNPDTGQLGATTQVWPRGVIRDVQPPDGHDVRITVLVFTPGNPHSQEECIATEGDFVDKPFLCAIDIAPRQINYLRYDFCRFVPSSGGDKDCQYVRIGRPEPPPPDGSPPPPPTDPDRDGDGVPASRDCRDDNATVWPGAPEIPGNKIDDDCTGGDAPARIVAGVKNRWIVVGARTRVRELRVRDAPDGVTVTVRCLGKRCAFRSKDATAGANLRRLFRKPLRPGMTIEVRITAPNSIGKVVRYRMRRGKLPADKTLCLPPGAAKPRRC